MILHWDKDGTPLETLEWAHKFEDYDYRFVGHDQVGPYRISTLWMGMPPVDWWIVPEEFRTTPGVAPPVFETAVFMGREEHVRIPHYSETEALERHLQMVGLLHVEVRRRPTKLPINGHEYRRRKAHR